MSEHEVEIWVERQVDHLDRKYMKGQLSTDEYHSKMLEINNRANELLQNYADKQ